MIKQNLTQQPERFYECIACNEAIFNPLCHNCLAQQLEVWLTSYPDLKQRLMPKIKAYLRDIENSIVEATNCVACHNQKAAVCPYCFTELVLDKLKELQVNKTIKREFLQFFNFDFEHTGYTKDAEELGMLW